MGRSKNERTAVMNTEATSDVRAHTERLLSAARALVASAETIAAGNPRQKDGREAVEGALRTGSVALCLLKKDCRIALEDHISAASSGSETRLKIDEKSLNVRAFAYENRNLESMIASCRNACETCDAKITAMGDIVPGPPPKLAKEIEDSHRQAAAAGADGAADAKIAHEKLAWRLGEERRARAAAVEKLSVKRQKLDELRGEVHKKRKWLLAIEEEAKEFISGSRQFQRKIYNTGKAAGDSGADAAALGPMISDAAKKLPGPLYVAYCQLMSAKTADNLEIDVDARCDADADAVARSVKDDSGKHLYKASDAYFTLRLSSLGEDIFTVIFRYLPNLHLVVVETERTGQNELLSNLFKDDDGRETPNMANLSLLNGRFSFDSTVNMRPYKWAQRIAGIDLVVDKGTDVLSMEAGDDDNEDNARQGEPGRAAEGEIERSFRENRAMKLVAALIQRYKTLKSLKYQIGELLSCRLPAIKGHHALSSYVPRSKLGSFEAIEMATSKGIGREQSGVSDADDKVDRNNEMDEMTAAGPSRHANNPTKMFRLSIETEAGAPLTALVKLESSYPNPPANFMLSCAPSGGPLDSDAVSLIETEVNYHLLADGGVEELSEILAIQFRRLFQCIDVCCNLFPGRRSGGSTVFHTVDGRLRRGRDRRLPLVFNDASGCVQHR